MRLLAVNQFYAPDISATAQLLTQLCEDLVAQGDEVTVVAARGRYLGGHDGGGGNLPAQETIRGVEVVRPWTTSWGKATIAHRLGDYLSYWSGAVARVAAARRPDVVLSLTTPPMIATGVAAVCRARGIPLVLWVQDVYPELAVAFELLPKHHPICLGLAVANRLAYRQAGRVVALADDMAIRLAATGAPLERLEIVHNWADGQAIEPVSPERNRFRRDHGLEERFVVMYSGNLGRGHDVRTFVGAARRLERVHPEVLLLFVGDGARRKEAEGLAAGLANVRFLPYQPAEALAESLSAADVHLASLRPGLEGLLVPSKLYGVLAAGRPLLFVGPERCEIARVIRAHQIGWVGTVGDEEGLARAIGHACTDRQWAEQAGARARELLLERFDRRRAVRRWRALLADVAARR